jgi:hypothetical protein
MAGSWKLEPLNDGLPEDFRFGMPRFLSKVYVESLGFLAAASVANATAKMADIERWQERAAKTDETGILTRGFWEFRIVCTAVHVVDHVSHGTLAGLECYYRLEEGVARCKIGIALPFGRVRRGWARSRRTWSQWWCWTRGWGRSRMVLVRSLSELIERGGGGCPKGIVMNNNAMGPNIMKTSVEPFQRRHQVDRMVNRSSRRKASVSNDSEVLGVGILDGSKAATLEPFNC